MQVRKFMKYGVTIALCFAAIASLNSQTLEKKSLSLAGAERAIAAAKSEATRLQAPGAVIAVVDDGGNLLQSRWFVVASFPDSHAPPSGGSWTAQKCTR